MIRKTYENMLTPTNRLKIFILLIFVYSVIFFYLLNEFITSQLWSSITLLALIYALLMAITGFILGFKDKVTDRKISLGFLYHFYTFIVVNFISVIWILMFQRESILDCLVVILAWGIGLLVHYLTSRKK
jgi:hypothetical protein